MEVSYNHICMVALYINFTCYRLSHEDLKSLPKLWLNGILDVLKRENKNAFYKLCPTRRSAGLPFMIQVRNI